MKCKCGCGNELISKWSKYNHAEYIKGHGRKGRKNSPAHNLALKNANITGKYSNCSYCKGIIWITPKHLKRKNNFCNKICYSLFQVGKSPSKESIEKSRLKRIGHAVTQETREKISKANYGQNNGMFGITINEEGRRLRSINTKKMWQKPGMREKLLNHPNRKENCRIGAINAGYSLRNIKKFTSKPELKMLEILKNLGYKFIHHYSVLDIEHKYIADFYLIDKNTIIEVDGTYWHNYPNLREIDLKRNKELTDKGYQILRFWENELDIDNIKNKLGGIQ